MCESVLSEVLEGKIRTKILLEWLSSKSRKGTNSDRAIGNRCVRGDFISFFLNYIHEIHVRKDNGGEMTQKLAATPKRISRQNHGEENARNAFRKRGPLFAESAEPVKSVPEVVTPKTNTRRSIVDESYMSPISPLYSNAQNSPLPKYVSPKLTLGDFIVRTATSTSRKKVQRNLNETNVFGGNPNENNTRIRRINPTNVTQKKQCSTSFRQSENSFSFKESREIDNTETQRNLLIEERLKVMSSKRNLGEALPTLTTPKPCVVTRKSEIVPKLECVTFQEQLNVTVSLYGHLLRHNFVLNLTSELYFLVSVLLEKEYEILDDGNESSPENGLYHLGVSPLHSERSFTEPQPNAKLNLFKTIHNRVYFASKVLQNQTDVLRILDGSTLRLLSENKRLKLFCPSKFLDCLSGIVRDAKNEQRIVHNGYEQRRQICFISDTDNRDNFPSDTSFHAFRKQRDLFYDILRVWENNRSHDEWNFVMALGGKIKALLNMHGEPANLVHLARLFKAQLLATVADGCGGTVEEEHLSIFSSIPNVDVEKLSRLKDRIVTKKNDDVCGLNAVPTFAGHQEFYRDFVSVAAGHFFNRHLIDTLISEIIELNESKLFCSDLDDIDYPSARKSYSACVKSLRLLAKFLGFLETLPYKTDCAQLSQNVVASHLAIRNQVRSNLDLKRILESAVQNGNLILTIPWLTEYLAMLDYVTLRLACYEHVFRLLYGIYCGLKNTQNDFLIRLCLGWLFELPHFPESSYYTWLSQGVESRRNGSSLGDGGASFKNARLDELEIVDQNILYACCPYLEAIKKILSNDVSCTNNGHVTVKHITPLTTTTATSAQSPMDLSNKRLQLQLEENFFNGQPISVRKTVEFVRERVASACVKLICNEIVPVYKKEALNGLRGILEQVDVTNEQTIEEDRIKQLLTSKANEFAASSLKCLRARIDEKLKPTITERIVPAMEALLAADVLQQTKEVCVTIATQSCNDRVMQWVNSHVNLGVFAKDFDNEIKRACLNNNGGKQSKIKPVFRLPGYGRDVEHNPSTLSAVKVVESIRRLVWRLLEVRERETITIEAVTCLLDSVLRSITERCDVNECILVSINRFAVDLVLLLIAHRPGLISDDELVSKFVRVWRTCPHCDRDNLFGNLLCPRNVTLLTQSSDMRSTWRQFDRFVAVLLKEELLTREDLETQSAGLEKQKWNEEILAFLSKYVQNSRDDNFNDNITHKPSNFVLENCVHDAATATAATTG